MLVAGSNGDVTTLSGAREKREDERDARQESHRRASCHAGLQSRPELIRGSSPVHQSVVLLSALSSPLFGLELDAAIAVDM